MGRAADEVEDLAKALVRKHGRKAAIALARRQALKSKAAGQPAREAAWRAIQLAAEGKPVDPDFS